MLHDPPLVLFFHIDKLIHEHDVIEINCAVDVAFRSKPAPRYGAIEISQFVRKKRYRGSGSPDYPPLPKKKFERLFSTT
jgi:hypothetical protein